MAKPLRVLLVEDSERDAALLLLYLRRAGYEPTLDRVETGPEMQARLGSNPDIVISDINLPRFSAAAALKVLQESGRQVPFIVVSGEADERIAAEMMNAGAAKYLVKGQMAQIVAAIDQFTRMKPETK